jgi:hypothetical protein
MKDLPFVKTAETSDLLSLYWDLYTVEVGSTAVWNPASARLDSLTSRAIEHRHSIDSFTSGSIAVSISSGSSLPGVIARVAGHHAKRLDAQTATVHARLHLYVRQPGNQTASRRLLTDRQLMLDDSFMRQLQPQLIVSGGSFDVVCGNMSHALDGEFPATTGYACDTPTCATTPQNSLPSFVVRSFSPTTASYAFTWLGYKATVSCNVTAKMTLNSKAEWVMPLTEVRIPYGIRDGTDNSTITDTQDAPFASFFIAYARASAVEERSLVFPLSARVVQLNEVVNLPTTLTKVSLPFQIERVKGIFQGF